MSRLSEAVDVRILNGPAVWILEGRLMDERCGVGWNPA
jgi:hypothetical protein